MSRFYFVWLCLCALIAAPALALDHPVTGGGAALNTVWTGDVFTPGDTVTITDSLTYTAPTTSNAGHSGVIIRATAGQTPTIDVAAQWAVTTNFRVGDSAGGTINVDCKTTGTEAAAAAHFLVSGTGSGVFELRSLKINGQNDAVGINGGSGGSGPIVWIAADGVNSMNAVVDLCTVSNFNTGVRCFVLDNTLSDNVSNSLHVRNTKISNSGGGRVFGNDGTLGVGAPTTSSTLSYTNCYLFNSWGDPYLTATGNGCLLRMTRSWVIRDNDGSNGNYRNPIFGIRSNVILDHCAFSCVRRPIDIQGGSTIIDHCDLMVMARAGAGLDNAGGAGTANPACFAKVTNSNIENRVEGGLAVPAAQGNEVAALEDKEAAANGATTNICIEDYNNLREGSAAQGAGSPFFSTTQIFGPNNGAQSPQDPILNPGGTGSGIQEWLPTRNPGNGVHSITGAYPTGANSMNYASGNPSSLGTWHPNDLTVTNPLVYGKAVGGTHIGSGLMVGGGYLGGNLFPNGSFENGANPDGVANPVTNGFPAVTWAHQFFSDNTQSTGGTKCLRLDMPTTTPNGQTWARTEAAFYTDNNLTRIVNPSGVARTIRMTWWARASSTAELPHEFAGASVLRGGSRAGLIATNANASNYAGVYADMKATISSTAWTFYSADFQITAGTANIRPEFVLSDYNAARGAPVSIFIDSVDVFDPDFRANGGGIVVDTVAPTLTLSSAVPANTSTAAFNVSVLANESIYGFDASKIVVTNGTVSNFVSGYGSGSATPYTFTVTASGQGPVTVKMNAGATSDTANNPNAASNTIATNFDTALPTVISKSPDQGDTVNSINSVSITFSEPVTGVTQGALTVNAVAATGVSGTGAGPYVFTVTNPPDNVAVPLALNGAAIKDAANNALANVNWTVNKNSAAVTAFLSSTTVPDGGSTNQSPVHFLATFSESVQGFDPSDITVQGGTISNVAVGYNGENLFTNGSFENGTIPDFVENGNSNGYGDATWAHQFFQDNTQSTGGTKCLRLDMPTSSGVMHNGSPQTWARTEADLYADNNKTRIDNPGRAARTIRMTWWARANSVAELPHEFAGARILAGGTAANLIAFNASVSNYNGFADMKASISATAWTFYSADYAIPNGTVTITPDFVLSDYNAARGAPVSFFIDSVDVYDPALRGNAGGGSYLGGNLYANNSFENKTTAKAEPDNVEYTLIAGWATNTYGPTSTPATPTYITQSSAEAHSGTKSLQLTMPVRSTSQWWRTSAGLYAATTGTLKISNPGAKARTVRFSVWMKSNGAPVQGEGVLLCLYPNGTGTGPSAMSANLTNYAGQFGNAAASISTTWQEYWVEYPVPAGGSANLEPQIMISEYPFDSRAQELRVFVDDVDVFDPALRGVAGARHYTFDVIPSGQGTTTVTLAAGIVTATAPPNNPNAASNVYDFIYDTVAPSVVIGTPTPTQTNTGPVDFPVTITGSSTVNLTAAAVSLNASGGVTGTVSVLNGGTASPTVHVDGLSGIGSFTISIGAGVASDAATNTSAAAGPSDSVSVGTTVVNAAKHWTLY